MSSEVLENGYPPDIPLDKVSETLTQLESPPDTPLATTDGFLPDDPPVVEIEVRVSTEPSTLVILFLTARPGRPLLQWQYYQ